MVIQSGKVESLNGLPWAGIEFYEGLQTESQVEEIVRHTVQWSRIHLRNKPFQMLVPVKSRGVNGIELFSPYLWARTQNLKDLKGVRTIPGIEGVITDTQGHMLPVTDEFAQNMIAQAQKYADAWCAGIERGSFVRVLMGQYRMLCGKVKEIRKRNVVVTIALRSTTAELTIALQALQNLGSEEHDYFYTEN